MNCNKILYYLNKAEIVRRIIEQLSHDLEVFFTAAIAAHEAAIHEENQPDNSYDTLALEASYVAQGQANRARELRQSVEVYRQLTLTTDSDVIRLTSLVTIEADDGTRKVVFIGPREGGLKVICSRAEVMVITPASPLGQELFGRLSGDSIEIATGANRKEYEIVEVR